jgi:hypothetical protein
VLLVSDVVIPAHTLAVPPIVAGLASTVAVFDVVHPPAAYVIDVVPAAMPVTTPVLLFIVPIAVLLLLHTPPLTA